MNSAFAPYLRARGRRLKATNARQFLARANYTRAVTAWREATQEVRNEWQASAITISRRNRLGVSRTRIGFGLWMQIQILRLTAGEALLTNPPTLTTSTPPPERPFSTFDITDTPTVNFGSDPFSPGGNSFRMYYGAVSHSTTEPRLFKYWRFLLASFPIVGSQILTPEWLDAFGPPVEDEWVALRVVNYELDRLPAPASIYIDRTL